MKKVIILVVGLGVCSVAHAQDRQIDAKPVYDNMQLEKLHKQESKNLTYTQSAAMWTGEESTTNKQTLTGDKPQPVRHMSKFATPSTFKPQSLQVQPLMKQSAAQQVH